MVFHLSIPPQNERHEYLLDTYLVKSIDDPMYGGQLSDFAIEDLLSEGQINVSYEYIPIAFDNGTVVTLSKPIYSIKNLNYGDLHPDIQISARVAQPMIGLGLIQAISQKDILVNEDPDDENNDTVSGVANIVWDYDINNTNIGLFGWKAAQPSIRQQSADAFHNDMGLSSKHYPNGSNCSEKQIDCNRYEHGNSPTVDDFEVSSNQLDLIEFYSSHLAVPARRNHDNEKVLVGKKFFMSQAAPLVTLPNLLHLNQIIVVHYQSN